MHFLVRLSPEKADKMLHMLGSHGHYNIRKPRIYGKCRRLCPFTNHSPSNAGKVIAMRKVTTNTEARKNHKFILCGSVDDVVRDKTYPN